MGVTDPRKLAVILLDLEDELERWSASAGNVLQTARYTQNLAREQVEIARRQSRLITEDFYETAVTQRARKENVTDLNHKSGDAVDMAQALVSDAEKKQREVAAILTQWENELKKAQAWQKRAEDRLRQAEAELAAAERALSSSERDLSNAEAALRHCQNTRYEERDSNGRVVRVTRPDCSGYVAAVARARAEVVAARGRVRSAQVEVVAARGEVGRARARAQGCSEAVTSAKQSLTQAKLCLERSSQSQSEALRSLDYVQAAQRSIDSAGDLVEDSRIIVTDMNNIMQKAEDHLGTAQEFLVKSANAEESAQRYRIILRAELQYRTEMLYALNVPELGTISASPPIRAMMGGATAVAIMATKASSAVPKRTRQFLEDPTKKGVWYAVNAVLPIVNLPFVDEPDEETRKMLPLESLRMMQTRLTVMLPHLQEGAGENASYWAAQDAQENMPEKWGYKATYDAYRGQDPIIIVELDDGTYWIKSGKTRVWLAQQAQIEALPVKLMKHPDYLVPRRFRFPDGQSWEMRAYEDRNSFKLRVYNVSQRIAIPEVITDGDGICLDAIIEATGDERTLVIQRFDFNPEDQEHRFADEAVRWSEAFCGAQDIETCSFVLPLDHVSKITDRDWYQALGYTINREGQTAVIYKRVREVRS